MHVLACSTLQVCQLIPPRRLEGQPDLAATRAQDPNLLHPQTSSSLDRPVPHLCMASRLGWRGGLHVMDQSKIQWVGAPQVVRANWTGAPSAHSAKAARSLHACDSAWRRPRVWLPVLHCRGIQTFPTLAAAKQREE